MNSPSNDSHGSTAAGGEGVLDTVKVIVASPSVLKMPQILVGCYANSLMALLRLVCKDVFELAAVDEASLDVAGGVGEAHGVAAQGLEPAVDGFGGSVA